MKHRKYIFIAAILIVIIGLLAFYLQKTSQLRACKDKETQQQQNNCLVEYAAEQNEIEICDEIDSSSQGACLREVYIARESLDSCLELKEDYPLDSDICISGVAKAQNNLALCERIELNAAKDSCVKQVVIASDDISGCDLITNQAQQEFCYIKIAQNTNDLTVCENINSENQLKLCFTEYKLITGEEPNCSLLTEENSQICTELTK